MHINWPLFYKLKHKSSKLVVLLPVVCIIVMMTTLGWSELSGCRFWLRCVSSWLSWLLYRRNYPLHYTNIVENYCLASGRIAIGLSDMDSCHRLVSNIWLLCGRRDGIVHFMTHRVLETCHVFTQTNCLCRILITPFTYLLLQSTT